MWTDILLTNKGTEDIITINDHVSGKRTYIVDKNNNNVHKGD